LHESVDLCRKVLAPLGINVLVVEVNYGYRYSSHPGVSSGDLTRDDVQQLVQACAAAGIRVIPQFQSLGHQSRKGLLKQYPELDESGRRQVQYRSWCPNHPKLLPIVTDLIDELLEAFGTKAMHVGMDEVVALGHCPRCKGRPEAELFANAVKDLHAHIVGKRGAEMIMWGDRLLDNTALYGYTLDRVNKRTAAAIDLIPKDIIIADWQYLPSKNFPSVKLLADRGFRVWPSTWRNLRAARGLRDAVVGNGSGRVLGMLFTCWTCGRGGAGLARHLNGARGNGEAASDSAKIGAILRDLLGAPSQPAGPPR
jgi:hypothetical protein